MKPMKKTKNSDISKRPIIAVIGDSVCTPKTARDARETGRLLALRGAIVICGGYGGVMEEAARGAKSAGGLTIGILSGKDRREANKWIDIPVVTGMRDARNVIIIRSADGVCAVSGKYGTLSEIAFALNYKIPVVGVHSWKLEHPSQKELGPAFSSYPTPAQAITQLFLKIRK